MRRFFLLSLLLLLAGCASREKEAEAYLQERFPWASFEVSDAGEVMPLYYPGLELMGISGMLKEPESKEFKDACLHFEEVMKDPVAYTMAHPTEQNMKGFRAWVSGPQGGQYAVFFYGTSEIINSTIDLQLQYNDLLETALGIDF